MNGRDEILVGSSIDSSESFVNPNGSFFCGTTKEQNEKSARVARKVDMFIHTTDLHPINAPEHSINGGLYPAHNAIKPWEFGPDFVYNIAPNGDRMKLGDKTLSPVLTKDIEDALEGRLKGIIVPKGVYYPNGRQKAWCTPQDVIKTFEAEIISPDTFVNKDYSHIVAPKQYFDATRLDSDRILPRQVDEGVPSVNYNVYDLLKEKYPESEYRLTFVNTGVVEGICRLHTSIGLREMFPESRIINLTDATTPLAGIGLGYETAQQSRDACTRVCKDVGVEYMDTEKFLGEVCS